MGTPNNLNSKKKRRQRSIKVGTRSIGKERKALGDN